MWASGCGHKHTTRPEKNPQKEVKQQVTITTATQDAVFIRIDSRLSVCCGRKQRFTYLDVGAADY